MSVEFDEARPSRGAAPLAGPAEGERMSRARPVAFPREQVPWGPRPRPISDGLSTERAVASEGSEDSSGAQARPSFGMAALLLFILVLIARIPELFPGLAVLRLGTVTAGMALLALLVSPKTIGDKIPVHIKQVQYLLVLFGLSWATIPVAVWPGGSFEFVVDQYWKRILLFLLVLFWCRSVPDLRRLMWAYCLGATLLVGSGLISEAAEANRFNAGSTTFDANDLALLLVMVVPFLAYLMAQSRLMARLVVVPMIALCLGGIILTQSRGGFLSLLTVGGLILVQSRMRWVGKASIVAVAVLSFILFANQSYWERIEGIWNPKNYYDQSGGGRTDIWLTGLETLASNPWGIGIANFEISEGQAHQGRGKWFTAHNSFLQVSVELGVAGFVAFVLLLGRTLWELRLIRLRAGDEDSVPVTPGGGSGLHAPLTSKASAWRDVIPVAGAVEISLWAFVVGGSFLSQAYSAFVYGILALGVAAIVLVRRGGGGAG